MEVSTGEVDKELTLVLVGREARSAKGKLDCKRAGRGYSRPRGTLRWEGLQSCLVLHGVFLLPYGPIPGGSDG